MNDGNLFKVNVTKYYSEADFFVYYPASLDNPKNNAVMFVTESYLNKAECLLRVKECLVFWPEAMKVPDLLEKRHAIIRCKNPRVSYCFFFKENHIMNLPPYEKVKCINGSYISSNAVIGKFCTIMPCTYISGNVTIGENVYIGSGVKIVGKANIGNNVVIRENTVIGADGLSTDRNEKGESVTMPQFGGVVIEDNVEIGANTVIGRGAIDDTIIHSGCKIDNSCFISHNVELGKNTFIVGESILFGSSSTGEQAYISGNSTIKNGIHIGKNAMVGMGSVVTKAIKEGETVWGSPAKMHK